MPFSDSPSPHRFGRRRLLKASIFGAATLALYSGGVERHWIEITRHSIVLPGLPAAFDGWRIAHLTDIHLDEFTEPFFLRHAIDQVNSLEPDAVLLTGDFISYGIRSRASAVNSAWQCAHLLDALNCKLRFAVLGNHEVLVGRAEASAALAANRIPVLCNASVPIERSGARIWLAGLDDPTEGRPNPDLAIPAPIRNQPSEPVLLMCHAPDYADNLRNHPAGSAVGLMLSGHTHGGQIRLPLLGAMVLPELGKKYVEGWFRFGNLQLYVNRGIGTVGAPFRLNCPPEIALITLRANPRKDSPSS